MTGLRTIAFDGDDTLWHNENLFELTQDAFRELLLSHVPDADISGRLHETEIRNLRLFGYGIKGFMLSMIETAIEVTDRRVPAADIEKIIDLGKSMLEHPVELLEGVESVLQMLRDRYELMLITKGDLFDQESKIARSGLAEQTFTRVEIVSEKDENTYQRILERYELEPAEFLMVGNSLRSDILPVAGIGGRAVYIPYHLTWAHEVVQVEGELPDRVWQLEAITALPRLLGRIGL